MPTALLTRPFWRDGEWIAGFWIDGFWGDESVDDSSTTSCLAGGWLLSQSIVGDGIWLVTETKAGTWETC